MRSMKRKAPPPSGRSTNRQSNGMSAPNAKADLAPEIDIPYDTGVKLIHEILAEIENDVDPSIIEEDIKKFMAFSDHGDWRGILKTFPSLAAMTSLVSKYEDWDTRFKFVDYLVSCSSQLINDVALQAEKYYEAAKSNNKDFTRNLELTDGVLYFFIIINRLILQLDAYTNKQRAVAQAEMQKKSRANLSTPVDDYLKHQKFRLAQSLHGLMLPHTDGQTRAYVIDYLWKPDVIDPMFVKIVSQTVFACLNRSDTYKYETSRWLSHLLRLVTTMATDFHETDAMVNGMIEFLFAADFMKDAPNATTHIAEALNILGYAEDGIRLDKSSDRQPFHKFKKLGKFLTRLASRFCLVLEHQKDVNKGLTNFLPALADLFPQIMLAHYEMVDNLFQHECSNVRSAALAALRELGKSAYLSNDLCAKFDKRRQQKKVIVMRMIYHLADPCAQVRCKSIQVLQSLVENDRLPLDILSNGFVVIVGQRLLDKTIVVRKAALQFLTSFLENAVFGHDYGKTIHIDYLSEAISKLELCDSPASNQIAKYEAAFDGIKEAFFQELARVLDGVFERRAVVMHKPGDIDEDELLQITFDTIQDDPTKAAPICDVIYGFGKNLVEEGYTSESFKLVRKSYVEKLVITVKNSYVMYMLRKHRTNNDLAVDMEQLKEKYDNEKLMLKGKIAILMDKLLIERQFSSCIPNALKCVIMGDASEMKEAIKFMTKCKQFNVGDSDYAIRSMCALIWRQQSEVRQEILDAAAEMYIAKASHDKDSKVSTKEKQTVRNLMEALSSENEEDILNVEEVIYHMAKSGKFGDGEAFLIQLWNTLRNQYLDDEEKVKLLRVIYAVSRSPYGVKYARQNLRHLQMMLRDNPPIVYEVLRIISTLHTDHRKPEGQEELPDFRVVNNDQLFNHIETLFINIILKEEQDDEDKLWFGTIRFIVACLFNISKDVNKSVPHFTALFLYRAQRVSEYLMAYTELAEKATEEQTRGLCISKKNYYTRVWIFMHEKLCTFIGEVFARMHEFVQTRIPKMHTKFENKMKYAHANEADIPEEAPRLLSDIEVAMKEKKLIFEYTTEERADSGNHAYLMTRAFSEKRMFKHTRLLGRLLPIIAYCVRARDMPRRVRYAAITALGKVMTLSSRVSDVVAPMFFSLMSKHDDTIIRCNLIALCSDFAFSQPSLYELYSPTLFRMAQDVSPLAREKALLVISNLLSNHMIQVCSQFSSTAKCIIDPDKTVQKISRAFISELNDRLDLIILMMPDLCFRLACGREKMPFESYKQVVSCLVNTVKSKGKANVDGLVDKICHKFNLIDPTGDDVDTPKYLAFTLSNFNLSDSSFHLLESAYGTYGKFLNHQSVVTYLTDMVKTFAKNAKGENMRTACAEFVEKLERTNKDGLNNDILKTSNSKARVKPRAVKSRHKRMAKVVEESEESDDDDMDFE